MIFRGLVSKPFAVAANITLIKITERNVYSEHGSQT
jgi:hypothetical protein